MLYTVIDVGLPPTTALEGCEMSASVVAVGVAPGIPKYAPKLSLRATRPSPLTAWTKYLMLAGGLPSRPFHSRESSLPPHTAGSGATHWLRSIELHALVPSPV